jgi:protoheme IX farnesyltransferase
MMRTRNFSLLTIVFAFGLLLLGGMVHYSSNSLVCTSWPLCYGSADSLAFNFNSSHRLLGMVVGLLTILLLVKIRKEPQGASESRDALSFTAFLALFIVGIQGLLGGVTSFYRLPTIVNTSHFALSLVFVSIIIFIDHRIGRLSRESEAQLDENWSFSLSDALALLLFLCTAAIVLGAFVRHSGAFLACGSGISSAVSCVTADGQSLWPRTSQAQLHMFYRFISFGTWLTGAIVLTKVVLKKGSSKTIRLFALASLFALSFHQITGLVSIVRAEAMSWSVIHFFLGTISAGLIWKLNLLTRSAEKTTFGPRVHSIYRDLLDLTKPRLGSLVMSTVFVGMVLAPGKIPFFKGLVGFGLTFILVMGAAAFNCWMERDVDGLMDRTKERPLPSGRMKPVTALVFSSALLVGSLLGLYYFVNLPTAILGFTAGFLYLFAYTPLKQKSVTALYVGAIPGAIPPVMGWTIATGKMDAMAWILFAILFVWQLPHFLAISIYHAKDYGKANIVIYPNAFGLRLTKWGILVLTVVLAATALYPWVYDQGVTDAYGYFSLVLNILFTLVAIKTFSVPTKNQDLLRRWARLYFLGSIIYLPLLLGSMIYLS